MGTSFEKDCGELIADAKVLGAVLSSLQTELLTASASTRKTRTTRLR
jgi:hypothetical protein